MLLTYSKYQERKDADGKTFLDVECALFTSEPKMTRLRISIPSWDDIDPLTALHSDHQTIIHFYDKNANGLSNFKF